MPGLALVTGTSRGIGLHVADGLAARGAEVLRPRRDELDLSSLGSVREFAERMLAAGRPLELLVLNAGVFAPQWRTPTADGFDPQWEVNLLGHAALTARLLPLLRAGAGRVVAQTSLSAKRARLDAVLDHSGSELSFRLMERYAQSKLGLALFALELDRR